MLTSSLIEEDDMVVPPSPFSPHGAIGQPLNTPSSPTIPSNLSYPSTTQPKTPGLNSEFDLAALIAHAARQNEEKKSSNSQSGLNGYSPSQPSLMKVGVIGDGLTPKRGIGLTDDIWSDHSLKRTFSNTPIPGAPGSPVQNNNLKPGPLPLFQPFTDSNMPFTRIGTPLSGSKDVVGQVQGHLDALSQLVTPLLAAQEEVERLRKEVELWRGEWGKGEKERKRLEGIVEEQSLVVSNKSKSGRFSVVLIDGDGLIFQDNLLQSGFQGGQKAAKILLSALPNLSAHSKLSPTASHREITVNANGTISSGLANTQVEEREIGSVVVQLFVNKSGLGTALVKAGSVPSWGVYESFWQGFSAAHELFTVIDVGNGKEASDAKIKEYLRLYAKNVQCEMIVLGASHDNGYANILSSLQTESRLSKLLLLKGYNDLAYQLRQYSSRVVSIPDLFRSSKLATSAPAQSFSAVLQASSAPTSPRNFPPKDPAPKDSPKAPSEASLHSEDSVEVIEWEAVAKPAKKKEKEKAEKIKKVKKEKKDKGHLDRDDDWHEAGNRKVGKKYKGKGGVAVTSVRNLKPRPCHTYYLSPWGCKAGEDCDYGHDFRLTENQMDELSRLAKEIICPHIRNNKCHFTEEECVYGHVCPRGVNCTFGDTCRFNIVDNAHGEND